MSELEQRLAALAAAVDWPATPGFELPPAGAAAPPRAGRRRALLVVLAALVLALGIALAVPEARSAVLRLFHLGGVTVERVSTLPAAEERPLAAGLGRPVTRAEAETALGAQLRLPRTRGEPRLYARDGSVSALLATPEPVLLSELRSDAGVLKKVAGLETGVEWVEVAPGSSGVWIEGARHVVLWPGAPPRVAGNVLLFELGGVTYRLEGKALTRELALRLAAEIVGA